MSARENSSFDSYIGIDYSGAKTPTSSLPGLRIYRAGRNFEPMEILPPPGPRKYWTRLGVAEWLAAELQSQERAVVGIDHGFSFPLRYFEKHDLALDWPALLDDFQRHWPTDGDDVYVDFVRDGAVGHGVKRTGNPRWRRLTEERAGSAKSVFHFDVQGSVAKSTHSGLPWLRYLRHRARDRVPFLALRRVGGDGGMFGGRRGVPVLVEPVLPARGSDGRSARRLLGGVLAPPSGCRRQPRRIPEPPAAAVRTQYCRDRGLDSRDPVRRLRGADYVRLRTTSGG